MGTCQKIKFFKKMSSSSDSDKDNIVDELEKKSKDCCYKFKKFLIAVTILCWVLTLLTYTTQSVLILMIGGFPPNCNVLQNVHLPGCWVLVSFVPTYFFTLLTYVTLVLELLLTLCYSKGLYVPGI